MQVQKLLFLLFFTPVQLGCYAQYPLNFGFEQGSTCDKMPYLWSFVAAQKGANAQRSTNQKHLGEYSLQLTQETNTDSSSYNHVEFTLDGSCIAGQQLQLKGYYFNQDFNGKVKLKLDVYTGDPFKGYTNAVTVQHYLNLKNTKQWQMFTVNEFTLPKQDHVVVLQIEFNGKGNLFVDDLSIELNGKQVKEIPVGKALSKKELKSIQPFVSSLQQCEVSTINQNTVTTDLDYIKPMIDKARLIGLGESTHGTREFFQLKHRVLEYAVNQLGARMFLLEDNMVMCEYINRYVETGKGDLMEYMRGMFGVWFRQEVVDMIEWIKEFNIKHPNDKIRFAGIDVQYVAFAFDSLQNFLTKRLPALAQPSANLLKDYKENQHLSYSISDTLQKQKWYTNAKRNFKQIKKSIDELLPQAKTHADSLDLQWGLQYANLLQQGARNLSTNYLRFYRDSAMAENITWLLKVYPVKKAVLWAHDAHISKGSHPVLENNYYNGMCMGSWLHKWMGQGYVCFGLSTYDASFTAQVSYSDYTICNCKTSKAPKGSFEYDLHQLFKNQKGVGLMVNMQEVKKNKEKFPFMHKQFLIRMNNHVCLPYAFGSKHVLPYQFDGLFFIDKTTGSTLVK